MRKKRTAQKKKRFIQLELPGLQSVTLPLFAAAQLPA